MRWINVLVIFATFLAYLSPFINPSQFWQFSFFGLIYPWLLLSNLIMLTFWIFRKKKYLFLSLGCIILGWGHVTSFVGFNFFEKIETESIVTIGSYNIQKLQGVRIGKKASEERKKQENDFIHFLKRGDEIQILCTQETSKYDANFLKEKFNFPFAHSFNTRGTFIFSKYPIVNSGGVNFGTTSNSCTWADLIINEKKVRVYSIHFQSNQISSTADKVRQEGDLRKKETLKDIKDMMGKFKHYAKLRAEQAQKVANHIATCPHPVIVCGDFNDTPQSYTYHLLTKSLTDSFKEKGIGFGTTYAGSIPALRIDYILTHEKIDVQSHEILKENYSDHFPVICKISL
jgi:endonuclease/exonuclease/phosphatase family metal-dependent hydrolase